MSMIFKQLKVYVRMTLMVLVAGAVVLVLVKNRANTVHVWFFGLTDETQKINVIWLLLVTAAISLVCWWVVKVGVGLLSDMGEMRRLAISREREETLRKRETEVEQREQRIDDKVKNALAGEDSPATDD